MGFFTSATQTIPATAEIPKHIAVIMDGNGRWARKRFLPRVAGHKRGVETVRDLVKLSISLKVEYLTLFAFSSENWRRPTEEVSYLMGLFMHALKREVVKLHKNNIKLIMIGDRSRFDVELVTEIEASEKLTANNTGLILTIAANYGGRWDMTQAFQKLAAKVSSGELKAEEITEQLINQQLSISDLPEPDLFIRTGGEQRVSNFMLWQLAYTEMYFTQTLWPDFDESSIEDAIKSFKNRQRRFGHTSEQVINKTVSS